jgi:hypothetical protein
MSLQDLNRELYEPNSDAISERRHESSEFDPSVGAKNSSPFNHDEMWQKESREVKQKRKKKILIIAGAVFGAAVLAAGTAYLYVWWQKNAFHQDRVTISFDGPREVDSTQPTKYVIRYKNNNRVSLKNTEIELNYSENFQPTNNLNLKYLSPNSSKFSVSDISPMSEGSVELNGIFYAPKDTPLFLRGTISFVPSNGDQALKMENQISVNVTAPPVTLDLVAPNQIANGDLLEYVIDYKNLDIRTMANMQIRVDFPKGFEMQSSDPQPSEKGAYWYVGNLDANQGGKILIKGRLNGDAGESKDITVSLGHPGNNNDFVIFNKRQLSTMMVSPLLSVVQRIDSKEGNVIFAGEVLKYVVSYKNTSDIGLRNAVITAEIKGKILDFSKIETGKGSFNSSSGTITWKASDIPALANINPKDGGEVRFSIPVKKTVPIDSKLDKNLVVASVAKIDSPDIPTPVDSNKIIGSNTLEMKLASKVILDTKAYYNDEKIKNSGPIPMETGKETTFSVHWYVTNVSNDLSDARIVSSLPSGVRWIGKIYPENEKVSYDPQTNQVSWNIASVPAGSGVLMPARELVFQVGITPQANQVGQALTLVNASEFSAKDTFTGGSVSVKNDIKSSQLGEDSAVGFSKGKVAK